MFRYTVIILFLLISRNFAQRNETNSLDGTGMMNLTSLLLTNASVVITNIHRIVGGRPISIREAPYQAAVIMDGQFICGASILSRYWLLTAAHCVYGTSGSKIVVRAGTRYFQNGGQTRNIVRVVINGRYNPYYANRDVAMLKVNRPFYFTSSVRPVKIPSRNSRLPKRFFTSGWGLRYEDAPNPSKVLRGTTLDLVNIRACARAYKKKSKITKNMICAARPGQDDCQGDSGGPLVNNGVQYGIVSFGKGCARRKYPGVFTNVMRQRRWIRTVTKIF